MEHYQKKKCFTTGLNILQMLIKTMLKMLEMICDAIRRYAIVKIKYMKNYDKNKESSHHMYLDAYNVYGWAMP